MKEACLPEKSSSSNNLKDMLVVGQKQRSKIAISIAIDTSSDPAMSRSGNQAVRFQRQPDAFPISFSHSASPHPVQRRVEFCDPPAQSQSSLRRSLPNIRQLVSFYSLPTQPHTPNRPRPLVTPASAPSSKPGTAKCLRRPPANKSDQAEQQRQRALLKSKEMARRSLWNDCNLEKQEEERHRSGLVRSLRRTQDLTRQVQSHLKAENRPTRGLFYDMILSKRLEKTRVSVKDRGQGVVDTFAGDVQPEDGEGYWHFEQKLGPGGQTTLVPHRLEDRPYFSRQRYETPIGTALKISRQLDSRRRINIGINGRLVTFSASDGWSTSSSELDCTEVAG